MRLPNVQQTTCDNWAGTLAELQLPPIFHRPSGTNNWTTCVSLVLSLGTQRALRFWCVILLLFASFCSIVQQGFIRKCICQFQGRKSARAPLPDGPPDDVQLPTASRFYIKWDETASSFFNTTACNIVVDKVLSSWNGLLTEEEREQVFAMVIAHVKYLIKAYGRQQPGVQDASEIKRRKDCSADRRKRTVGVCKLVECYVLKLVVRPINIVCM